MGHRLMNALGAKRPGADDLRIGGRARRRPHDPGRLPAGRPGPLAPRAPRDRCVGMEPDVDCAPGVTQDPGGASRARRHPGAERTISAAAPRPCRGRAPDARSRAPTAALALGNDARHRRRRSGGRGMVPRARGRATTACLRGWPSIRSSHWAGRCGVAGRPDRERSRDEFATSTKPALLRLGVGAPAACRRADRLPDGRLPTGSGGRLAPRRRRSFPMCRRFDSRVDECRSSGWSGTYARGPDAVAEHVPARRRR